MRERLEAEEDLRLVDALVIGGGNVDEKVFRRWIKQRKRVAYPNLPSASKREASKNAEALVARGIIGGG